MLYRKTSRPPWWQRGAYYAGYAIGLVLRLALITARAVGLLAVLGVAAVRVDEAFFVPFFLVLGVTVAAVVEACGRRAQREYAKNVHPAYQTGRIRRDPQTGALLVLPGDVTAAPVSIPAQRQPAKAGDR